MNERHKQIIRAAMQRADPSDDYYRAKAAFGRMTDAELDRQYGQSGNTCREILAHYAKRREEWNEANEWLEEAVGMTWLRRLWYARLRRNQKKKRRSIGVR